MKNIEVVVDELFKRDGLGEAERYEEYIKNELYNGEKTEIKEICKDILETMEHEKRYIIYADYVHMLRDWAMGLPSIVNTPYVYDDMRDDVSKLLDLDREALECFESDELEMGYFRALYWYLDKFANR